VSAAPQSTFPVQFPGALGEFTCTANSPESIGTIFAKVVAQIFGYVIVPAVGSVVVGSDAGQDYTPGDIVAIDAAANSLLTIASTGTGGAVAELTLTSGGQCTEIGTDLPTTTYTGSGSGLTVNITSIKPVSTANDSTNPFWTVRVGWQKQGQPAWTIEENHCFITAYTDDDPFSRISDKAYDANDAVSLAELRAYTQVWKIHFVNYGPNAFTNAVLIVAAMALDWVHDALAAQNIYAVTEWKRPTVMYEDRDGQWWPRADVELRFNELVNMNLIVPAAASAGIQIIKENNLTETVTVNI